MGAFQNPTSLCISGFPRVFLTSLGNLQNIQKIETTEAMCLYPCEQKLLVFNHLLLNCFQFFRQMPTQTKLRHSWNCGVQKAFGELERAPQTAWELGTKGADTAKNFIKEQMK